MDHTQRADCEYTHWIEAKKDIQEETWPDDDHDFRLCRPLRQSEAHGSEKDIAGKEAKTHTNDMEWRSGIMADKFPTHNSPGNFGKEKKSKKVVSHSKRNNHRKQESCEW